MSGTDTEDQQPDGHAQVTDGKKALSLPLTDYHRLLDGEDVEFEHQVRGVRFTVTGESLDDE